MRAFACLLLLLVARAANADHQHVHDETELSMGGLKNLLLNALPPQLPGLSRHVQVTAQLPGDANEEDIASALAAMDSLATQFMLRDDALLQLLGEALSSGALPRLRGARDGEPCASDVLNLCPDAIGDADAVRACLRERSSETSAQCASAMAATHEREACAAELETVCASSSDVEGHQCLVNADHEDLSPACAAAVALRADVDAEAEPDLFEVEQQQQQPRLWRTVTRRVVRVQRLRRSHAHSREAWKHSLVVLMMRALSATLLVGGVLMAATGLYQLSQAASDDEVSDEQEDEEKKRKCEDGVEMPYKAMSQ